MYFALSLASITTYWYTSTAHAQRHYNKKPYFCKEWAQTKSLILRNPQFV